MRQFFPDTGNEEREGAPLPRAGRAREDSQDRGGTIETFLLMSEINSLGT